MEPNGREARRPESGLGKLMRYWREARAKSQFDLALETGVSQRHISFIESGRSIPSREKLMDIAEGLDVPLRERNGFLLAAGYAPIYTDNALDAPEMESIVNALERVLRQHEPFPAVVMDRYWNVVMANEAAPTFFGNVCGSLQLGASSACAGTTHNPKASAINNARMRLLRSFASEPRLPYPVRKSNQGKHD